MRRNYILYSNFRICYHGVIVISSRTRKFAQWIHVHPRELYPPTSTKARHFLALTRASVRSEKAERSRNVCVRVSR